jgi:hypothetical protein
MLVIETIERWRQSACATTRAAANREGGGVTRHGLIFPDFAVTMLRETTLLNRGCWRL